MIKTKKILNKIGIIIGILIILVCSIIIFFNVTHIYYNVFGPSMSPTLNKNATSSEDNFDGVLVSKIKGYTYSDIIVVDKNEKDSNGNEKYVIKRLIAMGGDKVTVRKVEQYYRIIIIKSGETEETLLEEDYITDYSINNNLNTKFQNLKLNYNQKFEGEFYVVAEDEVFYLGDNRLNSTDSSVYGSVKKDFVVGKVDYIIYGNTNTYFQVIKQFFGW